MCVTHVCGGSQHISMTTSQISTPLITHTITPSHTITHHHTPSHTITHHHTPSHHHTITSHHRSHLDTSKHFALMSHYRSHHIIIFYIFEIEIYTCFLL